MFKRLICAVAVVVLFTCPSFAFEIEGTVVDKYDMILFLDTGEEKPIKIYVLYKVKLKNLLNIHKAKKGDRLKVKGSKQIAGMLVVEEAEADPVVKIAPALKISVRQLSKLIKSGENYVLVDTRPAEMYGVGHIPTAVSMPEFDIKRLPEEKESLVVFYSGSKRDPRGVDYAEKALAAGYTNIGVCDGGYQSWVKVRNKKYAVTTVEYIKERIKQDKPLVFVDTRPAEKARAGYIPNAVSIPLEEINREVMKPLMPYPVVFYGEDAFDRRAEKAAEMTTGWRYTKKSGDPIRVLEGGFKAWQAEGLDIATGDVRTSLKPFPGAISIAEFRRIWKEKDADKVFLDVRKARPGYLNTFEFITHIPIQDLPFRVSELPKDKEIIVFCKTGHRARMVYHILKDIGYRVRYLNTDPGIKRDGTLQ